MTAAPAFGSLARQGLALSIGFAGALIAVRIGVPLPWMLGPMILVTLAAMASPPIAAPTRLRIIMLPVIGVMLGSGFHPGLAAQIGGWAIALAILPVFVAAAFFCAYTVYRVVGKYDPVTAYFSAAPGGLNDMMLIGTEAGGNERRIALAHASRILIVVSLVSLFFGLVLGIRSTGAASAVTPISAIAAEDLELLALAADAGALAGPRLRLPAPKLLGPMVLSGAIHITGLTEAPPPTILVNAAQLVIGTVIGCRFLAVPASEIGRDMALAAVASGAMLLVALAAALAVVGLTSHELAEAYLAYSPGGLPEMSLLALALGADVAYVATLHLSRIVLVIVAAPLFFRYRTRHGQSS